MGRKYLGLLGLIGFVGFQNPWYFLFFLFFLFFLTKPTGGTKKSLIDEQAKEKEANLQKIQNFLQSAARATNDDVQKLLGVSEATVTRYMDELEKQGKVKQVGEKGGFVYYEVIK